jgi:DNA-binding MarR family transcriptional regulator
MMKESTAESFYVTLVGTLIQAKRHVIASGARHGLTPAQSLTLLLMPSSNLLTMHDVSIRMGCDASNATGLIDALEQKKFIAREEKPGDRRTKMVRLLSDGQRTRQEIIKDLAANSEISDKLTAAEIDQLLAILQKISA